MEDLLAVTCDGKVLFTLPDDDSSIIANAFSQATRLEHASELQEATGYASEEIYEMLSAFDACMDKSQRIWSER